MVADLKENGQVMGKLIARAEPKLSNSKDSFAMDFQGHNMAGTFFFLPERAFFTISKLAMRGDTGPPLKGPLDDKYKLITNEKGEEWIVVYESELTDGANPKFRPIYLPLSKLCSNELNGPLKFTAHVSHLCDNHKYKGEFQTTCNELQSGPNVFKFIDKSTQAVAGNLQLLSAKVMKEYSMIEYLKGGTQMNLTVAIDFTGSNGDPHLPNSLHFCDHYNQGTMNQYQQAILSVGSILMNYDRDKEVKLNKSDPYFWIWCCYKISRYGEFRPG